MITRSEPSVHTQNWQQALSNTISSPKALLERLELGHLLRPDTLRANNQFRLKVPLAFVARMEKGNPNDPLLRQVLPLGQELEITPGYSLDPLGEHQQTPCQGVIHKYHGRLLLVTSGACAVNCRFCFRRHFPYSDHQLSGDHWQAALDYIAADTSIREVILSGGDPLAASDQRLARLAQALADISHVQTLRIHTRLPLMIPQRITDELLHWFTGQRLKPVMVVHCNHANEIDASVEAALTRLRQAGVVLLSQSVLLQGVNDNLEALTALSHRLFQAGVLPYYLHMLDAVQGAAHFAVTEEKATALIRAMMTRCPGYLVPRLVREQAGELSKTPITL